MGGAHRLQRVEDVFGLGGHIVAAGADGMRPGQVEKCVRTGLAVHPFRQQPGQGVQHGGVALHLVQIRVPGQRGGAGAAGAADGINRHPGIQQMPAQRHADGPGRPGDNGGLQFAFGHGVIAPPPAG